MKRKTFYILPYLVFSVLFLLPDMAFALSRQDKNGVGIDQIQISRVRDSVHITFQINLDSIRLRSNRSLVLQPFF